jgi:hypothetical protein
MDILHNQGTGDDCREEPQKYDGDQTNGGGHRSDLLLSLSLDDLGTLTAVGEDVLRYDSAKQLYTQEKN